MPLSRSLIIRTKIIKSQLLMFRIRHDPHCLAVTPKISLHGNSQIRFINCRKYVNSKLFTQLTGYSYVHVNKVMDQYPCLDQIDKDTILKVFNLLKNFGFKNEEIGKHMEIFVTHPLTIKSHFMVLEEAGVFRNKITLPILYKYIAIVRNEIRFLKTSGMIQDADVVKSILSYIEMPASACPPSLPDYYNIVDAQAHIMKAFMSWKLSMTPEELEKPPKIYVRLRHRSFRLIQDTLNILKNDIKFTKEKILSHAYLIHSDPDNIRELLKRGGSLGGLDLMRVFHLNPKIVSCSVKNIEKIDKLLKDFNIPDRSVAKVLDIYTLNPETVHERLKLLHSIPQFNVLYDNPLILKLVLYQRKATSRLILLKKLKMNCASLNMLYTNSTSFDKYTQVGDDRTRGDDVILFLSKKMSIERKTIRTMLNRHPYWYHVSIVCISETLEYLYSENFTSKEISKNIHIILYPKSLVTQELTKLEYQSDLEICRTPEGNLRRDTILPLILYYIEQPHHFSGGAIWSTQSIPLY